VCFEAITSLNLFYPKDDRTREGLSRKGPSPIFGVQPEEEKSVAGRAFHHFEDFPALAGQQDRARGEMQMKTALGAFHNSHRNMPVFFTLGGILSGYHFCAP
jgi:hypothetical protein